MNYKQRALGKAGRKDQLRRAIWRALGRLRVYWPVSMPRNFGSNIQNLHPYQLRALQMGTASLHADPPYGAPDVITFDETAFIAGRGYGKPTFNIDLLKSRGRAIRIGTAMHDALAGETLDVDIDLSDNET